MHIGTITISGGTTKGWAIYIICVEFPRKKNYIPKSSRQGNHDYPLVMSK